MMNEKSELQSHESFEPGDLFKPCLWPGTVTCRSWIFKMNTIDTSDVRKVLHKVCLRHGQVSGQWILIVDGTVIKSGSDPINVSFLIQFQIDGHAAFISALRTLSFSYTHNLFVEQKEIKELRNLSIRHWFDIYLFSLSIPDTRSFFDGTKQVTVYQIIAQSSIEGKNISIVERRFSEFVILDSIIKTQINSHIHMSNFPKLPDKVVNPWVDQSAVEFISSRRIALEEYLFSLMQIPEALMYADFFCFFGIHPLTGRPFNQLMSTTLLSFDP